MACHSALAAGLARFLAGPLVGGPLLVRRLAALARDLALLGAVHRGKSAILFCHTDLPDPLHARRLIPAHRRFPRPPPVPCGRLRASMRRAFPARPWRAPSFRSVGAATEVPRLKSGNPGNRCQGRNLAVSAASPTRPCGYGRAEIDEGSAGGWRSRLQFFL